MRWLLLALLFSTPLFAAEINPKEAGSTQLSFELAWVLEGEPPFTLKTFGFKNYSFQVVSFSSADEFTRETDSYGNSRITFHLAGVTKRRITVQGTAAINYANGLEQAGDAGNFLEETVFVELTPEIGVKARQITEGAENDFQKMVLLTEWVHNNVAYDESYGQRQCTSSEAFADLRGTCDEESHLLIAFARSLNVPARFVAGFVHSGESWGAHAWVEFAFEGEWVPADPTFNELGLLDATHLKFAHGQDQADIAQEVTEGVEVQVLAPEIELNNEQSFNLPYEYSFYSLPEEAGPGAVVDARVLVQSLSKDYLAAPLSIVVPTEPPELAVKLVESTDKLVYLPPKGKQVAEWRLVFPHAFKEGYAYNFSIQVNSMGSSIHEIIAGSGQVGADAVSSALVNELSAGFENGSVAITVEIANSGNTLYSANASCEFEGQQQTKQVSIPVGGSTLLQFVFNDPKKDFLTGEITLSNPQKTVRQPFELTVEHAQPTPAADSSNASLGVAAIGALLIAAAFVILHRPREPCIQAG